MTLKEFVDGLKKSNDKEKHIRKYIKREYVPYKEKINGAERIVNSSMYKEINGKRVFVYDAPARYLLFIITIVRDYLDVEIDTEHLLDEMDLVEENHIGNLLSNTISDVNVYQTVLNMVYEDAVNTEESITMFLNSKLDTIGLSLNAISDGFKEVIKDS